MRYNLTMRPQTVGKVIIRRVYNVSDASWYVSIDNNLYKLTNRLYVAKYRLMIANNTIEYPYER